MSAPRRSPLAVIWGALPTALRRRFVALQLVSVAMALTTLLGQASVLAFFAVLADPAFIGRNAVLAALGRLLGTSRENFLVVLASGFIGLLIAGALTNVFGARAAGRFAYAVGDRIRATLFAGYLRRDYLFHARSGPARLADSVLYQADRVTISIVNGQLLITNATIAVLVVASIAIVNPVVALVGCVAVVAGYLLAYRLVRARLARNGRVLSDVGAGRVAVVEEALHGIKYVLVAGAQGAFERRFGAITETMSRTAADTQFVAQLPRYMLECIAGVALIACAWLASGGHANGLWLAQLSFIAFAGLRLLPVIQQLYSSFVIIRSNRSAIERTAQELDAIRSAESGAASHAAGVALRQALGLEEVSFRYHPEGPLVLDRASLRIEAGTAVGITGASGCGKTTLVDVLLGLLAPTEGRVAIDGKLLDVSSGAGWRTSVGYVPQDVPILDASVRENIAFGLEVPDIDDVRVREAAAQAGALEFIEALPDGWSTHLGGLAGNLSGGQRQRIGIARALYHDPSLLLLDEATNALDIGTEQAIIDAVVRQRGARTVLIVTHGAEPLAACDCVYDLVAGKPVERSTHRVGAARVRA